MTWRDLNSDEQPQKGDRFINFDYRADGWTIATSDHNIIGKHLLWQRPVPEPQWIAREEFAPCPTEFPILAYFGKAFEQGRGPNIMKVNFNDTFTHWMPIPPLPQKDESEEAFMAFDTEYAKRNDLLSEPHHIRTRREVWEAAIRWAKKEEKA